MPDRHAKFAGRGFCRTQFARRIIAKGRRLWAQKSRTLSCRSANARDAAARVINARGDVRPRPTKREQFIALPAGKRALTNGRKPSARVEKTALPRKAEPASQVKALSASGLSLTRASLRVQRCRPRAHTKGTLSEIHSLVSAERCTSWARAICLRSEHAATRQQTSSVHPILRIERVQC